MTDVLRAAVSDAVTQRFGPSVAIVDWSGPTTRRWSWQVEITVRGAKPDALLLKVPRWEGAPTLEAALAAGSQPSTVAEAEGLRALAEAVRRSRDPGLTAVEVVAYLPAINGILMERLEARSLRRRLRLGRRGREMDAVMARVGRLVGVYHTRDMVERRRLVAADEVAGIEELVRGGPSSLESWGEKVAAAVPPLDGMEEPVGAIHGDLNLGNVLVDATERVALIDPNPSLGSLLGDVALLVGDMWLDRSQLLSVGRARRPASCVRWEASIMEGAGLDGEPLRAFRQVVEVLARWSRLETETSGARRVGLPAARRVLAGSLSRRLDAVGV